jgi:hypothetical protein
MRNEGRTHRLNRLIATAVAATALPATIVQSAAPERPRNSCYYPRFRGYWGANLREQRDRLRVCLIRFSYEIAAGPPIEVDPGFYAADYCQAAYTFEEERRSAAEHRPIELNAARDRAAAYARAWFAQGARLNCIPPSRR